MSEPPDEFQVWYAPAAADHPGPVERYCERLLVEEERLAADRFRVASARHQHVIGRAMARTLLSNGCCQPREIDFRLLDHGKPIVDQPRRARRAFNVAHTKGLVLCGIGPADPWLGVDVEWNDRRTNPELAQRYFAESEIKQLQTASDEVEHREMFLKFWTLKEAFIKAIGTGLYTPLDQFAFEGIRSTQPQLTVRDPELMRGKRWRFLSFEPREGFVAAVAVGDDPSEPAPNVSDSISVRLFDFEADVVDRSN